MPDSAGSYHHGDHSKLLRPLSGSATAEPRLDAIIVPTWRAPEQTHLAETAALAQAQGCPLVTLHSGPATSADQAWPDLAAAEQVIAIDLPWKAQLRPLSWRGSEVLAKAGLAGSGDVSLKRNLALILSQLRGWSRILFLDDDISGLSPADLRKSARLLDTSTAAGMEVTGCLDHSVVCHAYQRARGEQEEFIGSGALAVNTARCTSFFPEIYNHDWLFLVNEEGRLQPAVRAGQVVQDDYDPFANPARARSEEFGDVFAEGVYWVLDQGKPVFAADQTHWEEFLARRQKFIGQVLDMTSRLGLDGAEQAKRVRALDAALGRLFKITADLCLEYLRAWEDDRRAWRQYLRQLRDDVPSDLALGPALAYLEGVVQPGLRWRLSPQLASWSDRPSAPGGEDPCTSLSRAPL
jgi:hypothetical protein